MTRRVSVAVLIAAIVFAFASPALARPFSFPKFDHPGLGSADPPSVSAPAWVLYDASLGVTLASQNPDQLRAPASITKIMTVLLALELGDQTDMVRISARAAATGEREIGIWSGESVSLGALIRAAMVHSANDAATAIAEHIGGTVEDFVNMMNARAWELGMTRTSFVNPHGLDANGHETTANDMLLLGLAAMEREDFRDIAQARIVVFPNAPDGSTRRGTATNLLIGSYEGSNGIKTGFTNRARLTFVASAEREGRELFAVILGAEGSRAHLADAQALFDFGFEDLAMYGILAGQPFRSSITVANPTPTDSAAGLESLMHLAGGGLLDIETTDEAPEPIVVVTTVRRQSDPAPGGIGGALVYWVRTALGW